MTIALLLTRNRIVSYKRHKRLSPTTMTVTANVTNSEIWEKNKKYAVYQVVVNCDGKTWLLYRRYNEFTKLYDLVKKQYPWLSKDLKLPGKKLFGNNFSVDFINSRRKGLDTLVQTMLSEPRVLDHAEVRTFFQLDRLSMKSSSGDEDQDNDEELTITSNNCDKLIDLGPSEKHHAKASDFEFLKVIGKGSFGKVYTARHKAEDQIYAVKVLNKKMIIKRNERNHIMSERNVLLKNLNHPFLVGLYYSFQSREKLYFVLDYVNGGELFFHLQKERYFGEPRARFYAAEITSALGYLHSQGIIYRDLKPENILLDSDGHIILTDFGLCKEGLREKETTNTFCGTPEYLAPEVLRKESYDRTVDWWCLGAVLYEMLYGLPPFYSRDTAEMYDNILHKPVRLRTNISLAARSMLEGLLQKDKKKRLGGIEDTDELKRHEFFKPINWADLESKNIPPPFNPNVKGYLDFKNIDPEFTREAIPASVCKSHGMSVSSSIPDNAFQGFSYAPPVQLSNG
ncbi:serine/threonine-protein kinase Sgk2-like isoform X2 [Oppia nitens]|uniref:serine/threonine-protein kinase Sgk2-like isoform X2 n=1 Tax=Oppia nitens TaxID=1686743 RepID=UPI0023DBEBA1|nr:serine/threonine-protein kinase Sgk2-like isoform X2 [Oppia nitens]